MKYFLISCMAFFMAAHGHTQGNGSSVNTDSLQKAIALRKELYLIEKERYELSYAKNPRAATDSVNRCKMQALAGKGREQLDFYLANERIDTLKIIDLSFAGLEALPDFVLKARNLEKLILDYNHIRKLPAGLADLRHLKYLIWRGNHLDDCWWIHFPRLDSLKYLDLSNNLLTRLPNDVKKQKALQKLCLDENFFENIPVHRLKKADFLEEVTFNRSHVLKIGPARYDQLAFIKILRVNNSKISSIDASFYQLSGLQELYLQENELTRLPDGISGLSQLDKLSFYKNALVTLPQDFYGLNIRVADLYYNRLETISKEIGELEDLEVLYLAHNRIYSLPETIGALSELEELYLHHNRLSVLPERIRDLNGLKVARVNDNYLVDFPVQFLEMKELKDLDVSSNEITTIPAEVENLPNLELFTYQENPIDFHLPGNQYLSPMIVRMMASGVTCVPRIHEEEVADVRDR